MHEQDGGEGVYVCAPPTLSKENVCLCMQGDFVLILLILFKIWINKHTNPYIINKLNALIINLHLFPSLKWEVYKIPTN